MNTVITDVVGMIQELGFGTLGNTLYCGRVPDSQKTPTELWWLIPNGFNTIGTHYPTGENNLSYSFRLYYRSMNYKDVDQKVFLATKTLNSQHCRELPHFTITDINVTNTNGNFFTDEENRVVGYVAFEVQVHTYLESN